MAEHLENAFVSAADELDNLGFEQATALKK